jgi:uncharacterized protein (TIGR02246 family)
MRIACPLRDSKPDPRNWHANMNTSRLFTEIGEFMLASVLLGALAASPLQAQSSAGRAPGAPAANQPPAQGPQASATPPLSNRPEDEQAIRSMARAFERVYNAGDAPAVAGFFTDDAEIIDEEGQRVQGRASIQDLFAAMFRDRPGAMIEFKGASLRFLGPDVAKEEGQTRVKPVGTEESARIRHYTLLHARQGGRWLLTSIREEHEGELSHHERLKDLEWLIGEWVDESTDSTIHAACRWSDDKNFLLREFTIHVRGKPALSVTQRIGWDPLTRQVKSWVFDSEGGYGEALWTHNGEEWLIKSTGVLPDGRTATATNILTHVSPHAAKWCSIERTVGGQVVPDHEEFVIVRRPPQPKAEPATGSRPSSR